jgi:predicted DNA-binding transcriptional regulator AlpA
MTTTPTQDDDALLRASEAMTLLNMPRTSFYRNIRRGYIPRPNYMGGTPLWRRGDLKAIFNNLPATRGKGEK